MFERCRQAEIAYQEDLRKALEKKLAKTKEPHFRHIGWKPEQDAEEQRCPTCKRSMEDL